MSTSYCTLQTLTQQDTVTPCLLFILQPIYLHNLSLHTSSQPITSRIYPWLLYLLTNKIAHQGFGILNWLRLPLDSEDGFRTGCWNITRTTVLLRTPITQMIFFIQGELIKVDKGLESWCFIAVALRHSLGKILYEFAEML